MVSDAPSMKRNGFVLLLGGTLLLGGVSMIPMEPTMYSAADAEYDYQDLLVEMDNDLEGIYGESPSDEVGFVDFMDQQDVTGA